MPRSDERLRLTRVWLAPWFRTSNAVLRGTFRTVSHGPPSSFAHQCGDNVKTIRLRDGLNGHPPRPEVSGIINVRQETLER
eukprot:1095620-Pyramimonas_sp.AAC.1